MLVARFGGLGGGGACLPWPVNGLLLLFVFPSLIGCGFISILFYQLSTSVNTNSIFTKWLYTVISGPNKKSRGEFQADKGINLNAPKDGWKKNESGFNYLNSFDTFLAL